MEHPPVGTCVIVDVSPFSKAGVSLGTTPAAGTVIATAYDGLTVLLDAPIAGVSVVTVPPEGLVLVQPDTDRS